MESDQTSLSSWIPGVELSKDSDAFKNEQLFIDRAVLMTTLKDEQFYDLIDRGIVKIDLRMHVNESGGY